MGAYTYRLWMAGMKPIGRSTGDQYAHRTSVDYRKGVRRKLRAYHVHVHARLGAIVQGLLKHLAINHTAQVWRDFSSWLHIMNPAMPPCELVVANALSMGLLGLIAVRNFAPSLRKLVEKYRRYNVPQEGFQWAA
jgi:hypothetical protein